MKAINYNDGALTAQYGYYGYQAFVMGDWDAAPPYWGAAHFGRLWRIHSYAPSSHSVLQDLQYDYDPVGNVTRINDVKNGEEIFFTYDTLDRLTGASGAYSASYAYTAIGNLSTKTEGGTSLSLTYAPQAGTCPDGALSKPHAVVTASGNSYCYDKNGNMITRTVGSDDYELTYDAENRLTEVKKNESPVASFVYDGDGKRVKATFGTTTTVTIGDYYEQTGGTVKKYYYAAGQRVAVRQGGTLYWLLTDHLGSTAVTADSSGGQVAELRYWPYGDTRVITGTTPTTLRFTGQRWEGIIGLYDYQARYYDRRWGGSCRRTPLCPSRGIRRR